MMWLNRSTKLEILDLGYPHYSQDEYEDCLAKLNKIGEYLGGDKASFKELKKLNFIPETILDVGCGGGGFTQKLGAYYPKSVITGIDIAPQAIMYAQNHNFLPNVQFEVKDLKEIPSQSYDLLISTLVCHHLTDLKLISFLEEALRVARKGVILNDLHRHPAAWLLFLSIAPFFRNRLILQDGCLSIKRAFIKKDWKNYLSKLPCKGKISWHWPFRWIIKLEPL